MWKIVLGLTAVLLGLSWFSGPVQAAPQNFNMNLIVYDDEFVDYLSLSAENIQAFLNTKTGILKNYTENGKSAATIIRDAAVAWHISPKVLIVTLQKEQSLISNPNPSQKALDHAMGYGCPDSGSCTQNPELKGFANQTEAAAWQFRRYIDQISVQGFISACSNGTCWGPNIAKPITCISSDASRGLCTYGSTITITPANSGTAGLYAYTPHPGGNYSFWQIWKSYNFDLQRSYPTGTLLRASGSPHVWLIQNNLKRRFTNSGAFLSRYSFGQVITVPPDHLLLYNDGTEISYANYSLLASPSGGVYLLVNDTRRPITTREAFQKAGFRWEELVHVSWTELNKYTEGSAITVDNVYPSGRLLQNNQTGAVFFVQDGKRHPIVCREIFRSQFGIQRPIPVPPGELDRYTYSSPIGFKDAELVSSGGTAYVISKEKKLPIADPETFNAYRFSWANLFKWAPFGGLPNGLVHEQCLSVHPTGPTLNIADPIQSAAQ